MNNSLTEIYNRLSSVLKTEKIYERPPAVEEDLSEKIVEEKEGVKGKHKEKKTESFADSEIADKFFDEENIV
ncbi:unnamed protein product [marine sediment metagenome]|uniref:Uncharacterized protein n=1 Tax=marine sediment metagenome TaxID=412755 RepID=X1ADV6_9ZZZZ